MGTAFFLLTINNLQFFMFYNINLRQKYLDDKIKVRNFALAFEKEACSAEAQRREVAAKN